jgi:hypothetical protein
VVKRGQNGALAALTSTNFFPVNTAPPDAAGVILTSTRSRREGVNTAVYHPKLHLPTELQPK